MKQKAFSLIELLVVVAIISLLVSILLPSLTKAKALAKDVLCRHTLKQLYIAFYNYSNDNEERLPPCSGWGEGCGWDSGYGYVNTLYPEYAETPEAFFCPGSIHPTKSQPSEAFPCQDTNYYYRRQLFGTPDDDSSVGLNHVYTLVRPEPFAFLGDMYTIGGIELQHYNHVELNVYNGLISDGSVVQAKDLPEDGWYGSASHIIDFGLYWQLLEDSGGLR